jgi:Domain of unknown function (DUF1841)
VTLPTHSRDQLRRSYAEAWAKRVAGTPLSPLEALISDVIALHPEYQRVVGDMERALGFEPAAADTDNPFLHMGLHIAVREQVAIDRPPGVRELHQQLTSSQGDVHAAEHVLMEALGQTLWEAQKSGRQPDERHYLALARQRLGKG